MLVKTLLFVHVLSAFAFFMLHGTSAAMAFKLRTETDLARIRAMLDLSSTTVFFGIVALLIMGLSGLTLPFLVHIWDKAWLWLSIVLMVGAAAYMGIFNEKGYKILRKKAGLPYMQGNKAYPAEPAANEQEVVHFLQSLKVGPLALAGYIIPTIVLALMIFKPF